MDTIPMLAEVGGKIVEVETGEVLAEQDAGTLLAETLETYRRAKYQADILRLRMEDQQRKALAALDDDPQYRQDVADMTEARGTIRMIEDVLGAMFEGRTGKVSIDTSAAKVTWSVGRETWSLAHPASWYTTRAATDELERLLAAVCHDRVAVAQAVIDWLDPTSKTGDTPAPRITLREGGS